MSALSTVLLYFLALDGVGSALVAWGAPSALTLAAWAIGLAVLLALGERLGESFSTIEEKRRDRVGVFLGTIQLSVLVLAVVLAAGSPTPGLLRFLANVLSGYELLAVLLVRLTAQPRGLVGQSLALVALATLRGGPLAAWSSASALAIIGLYVGVDHHRRLLAAHRVDDDTHAARALGRTALLVLPVALVVGLAVERLAPQERVQPEPVVEEEGYVPLEEKPERELDLRALRALVVTGLVGAVAVYFVGRWMVRSRRGEKKTFETPEALRGAVEPIAPEARHVTSLPEYPGYRGRVVRAYLNLLRGAERVGFPRRSHETPREFADALGEPRGALGAATDAFARARYGPFEVAEAEVVEAEQAVDAVLGHLARPRPPEVVRDTHARHRAGR